MSNEQTTGNEKYTDVLELAFDAIKRVERGSEAGVIDDDIMAALWTGLAIAVEIRRLRQTLENLA